MKADQGKGVVVSETYDVVVLGAGVTGLAAAYYAKKQNPAARICVFDASDRVGGAIQTVTRDGFTLELGPDNFITNKPWALQLANELGLADEVLRTSDKHRGAMVVRSGKLMPIPQGFQMMGPVRLGPTLRSSIFSPSGKLRMMCEPLVKRRQATDNDDEALGPFVRRRFGKEVLERIAQPLIAGVYTADPETLSLRATLPRFLDWEAEHGSVALGMRAAAKKAKHMGEDSGARYSLFVSFKDGMSTLPNAIADSVGRDNIVLNTRITDVAKTEDGSWHITDEHGETHTAAKLIVTLPAHATAKLLKPLDSDLSGKLNAIQFASSAVLNLAYRRDQIAHGLDAFGFVVPSIENRRLIAGSFSHVKFPGRAPEGHALLRAFIGGALQPELFDLDNDALTALAQQELGSLLGITGKPLFTTVTRYPSAMPQYTVGHLDRIDGIEQHLTRKQPTLALAGISYRGVGIPDCVRDAEQAATKNNPNQASRPV